MYMQEFGDVGKVNDLLLHSKGFPMSQKEIKGEEGFSFPQIALYKEEFLSSTIEVLSA
ncbi:MAG: hypothetical protein U0Y68_06055 [Blastocatellia bacterium]